MIGLHPIIRRKRRPLLPVEAEVASVAIGNTVAAPEPAKMDEKKVKSPAPGQKGKNASKAANG